MAAPTACATCSGVVSLVRNHLVNLQRNPWSASRGIGWSISPESPKSLKIILSILIITLINNSSFAQTEFEDFSTKIFTFITKLNDQIDSFFVKEKAESLNRNLGYFENDLERYLNVRKELLDSLNKNNYQLSDKSQVRKTVSDLKNKLEILVERLDKIIPDVGNNLSHDAKTIIRQVKYSANSNRIIYLTHLEKLLEGKSVDVEELKKEGISIYNELVKSVELTITVQTKLKSKFNL